MVTPILMRAAAANNVALNFMNFSLLDARQGSPFGTEPGLNKIRRESGSAPHVVVSVAGDGREVFPPDQESTLADMITDHRPRALVRDQDHGFDRRRLVGKAGIELHRRILAVT